MKISNKIKFQIQNRIMYKIRLNILINSLASFNKKIKYNKNN